jgi:anti-anti-sigma factor
MQLSIDVRTRSDGAVLVSPRGELDHGTAVRFRDAVGRALAAHPPRVLVDLALVTFIDPAGVGALVSAHRSAEATGCLLAVENPSPGVRRPLQGTGLLATSAA